MRGVNNAATHRRQHRRCRFSGKNSKCTESQFYLNSLVTRTLWYITHVHLSAAWYFTQHKAAVPPSPQSALRAPWPGCSHCSGTPAFSTGLRKTQINHSADGAKLAYILLRLLVQYSFGGIFFLFCQCALPSSTKNSSFLCYCFCKKTMMVPMMTTSCRPPCASPARPHPLGFVSANARKHLGPWHQLSWVRFTSKCCGFREKS